MPALSELEWSVAGGYYPSCPVLPPSSLQNTIRAGRNVWLRPMGKLEVAKGVLQTAAQNVGGRLFALNDERASIAGALQGERLPYAGLLRYQNAVIFFLSELTSQQVYINEVAASGVTTSATSGQLRIAVPDGVGGYNTYDPGFDPPILPGGNVTTPAGGVKSMTGNTGVALAAWRSKTNANSAPSNIVYKVLTPASADIFKVVLPTAVTGQDGFLLLGTRWGDQSGEMRVVRYVYISPRGTFSATNGVAAITGDANTKWLRDLRPGDVTDAGTILSVTSDNAATLTAGYGGATGSAKTMTITTVAGDWYNGELGELISFDTFKPPRAAGILSFAGRVYLWGTDGKPGAMTGPGIRPLLDTNPEHVGLFAILTELGDDLLNVIAGDTRLFLMTQNTLESVTFTGQAEKPYVIRILHQPGFTSPTAGAVYKNQFYGYDEKPYRTVTDADIDLEFGAAVVSDMKTWDARRVVVAADPKNQAVLYCQRDGEVNTTIRPWMAQLGVWGPPHEVVGQVVDWAVVKGVLYLILLGGGSYRVNGWEQGTGATNAYIQTQPNEGGTSSGRKIVKQFFWSGKGTTLTVFTITPQSNYSAALAAGTAITLGGTTVADEVIRRHFPEVMAMALRIDFPADGVWDKLVAKGTGCHRRSNMAGIGDLTGIYDFLAAQSVEAQQQVEDLSKNASFTITGTAAGQVGIFNGATFQPGSITGDSATGVSVTPVASPYGLKVALAQDIRSTASPTFAALTLTAPLAVANGGTGGNTQAAARAGIAAAKAETPGVHTITLLKLTGGGADGSITWNADGVIVSFVDPT